MITSQFGLPRLTLCVCVCLIYAAAGMGQSRSEDIKGASAPNDIRRKVIEFGYNKQKERCFREEIWRGTNLVLVTIHSGKAITHAFLAGGITFVENDPEGKGHPQDLTVLRDDFPIEKYVWNPNEGYSPISTDELRRTQEMSAKALGLMTNLVDAVKSKDSHKIERAVERINKETP